MTGDQALSALRALAEPTRLAMLRWLVRRGPPGASAGEVAAAVGASPSRASFHLAALEAAGLVARDRVSRRMIYRADFAGMQGLMSFLWDECCSETEGPSG